MDTDTADLVSIIIIVIVMLAFLGFTINIFYNETKYHLFCDSKHGQYFSFDKCIKVIDGEAVRYGIAEINDRFYLYRWAGDLG